MIYYADSFEKSEVVLVTDSRSLISYYTQVDLNSFTRRYVHAQF